MARVDAAIVEAPLVVVVGPTASGKTAYAIEMARAVGGEIICADSRTIYAGMDIGTAKPTAEERALVPHWGLDLVEPGERYTVADFKQYTNRKIAEIRARGNVPFLVGGTGLYVDAVLFDYQFGDEVDPGLRSRLEDLSLQQLHEYCFNNNIELPSDSRNKRRLIRVIERKGAERTGDEQLMSNTIVVGIATDRSELRTRISFRAEQILTNGVVEEATLLGKKYGWKSEAMTGNVYPLIRSYLTGELRDTQLVDKFSTSDWQLAKRQLTWLRRNPHIYWGTAAELRPYVEAALSTHLW
jgi:tRNA dimethylallyltransferase